MGWWRLWRPAAARGVRGGPGGARGGLWGLGGSAVPRAGLKKFVLPPDYSGITLPERPKLKFMEKVPSVPKARREPRQLRDIRGPSQVATNFTQGQYGILALGGGYLHWGHLEMIRLTIGRCMDPKNMFAIWRVPAPYKPLTKKSLGHRMGGGKGPIDRYVTAVKSGRLVVELGGRCEFEEVKPFLTQVAHKLPFPAVAVSRQSLQQMREEEEEKRLNNQNPWTFERVITSNMLGMRRYLSPYDLKLKGRYWGKFFLKHRV
ncbi:39S ribosomal protein L16, mitochondrial [Gallus gallus]|uniref:39S ribosomal protein L16, mitochondrial n=1 Tax=Gallus gallus TaxID=9031 RepID=UPI000240BA77|nr:39S ribosomal protein L16, mitochondrial [Gallus gallus]|eukprot:XP_426396.5 39S ribosomal protein L16, mitochondrial [Gallus gallus]